MNRKKIFEKNFLDDENKKYFQKNNNPQAPLHTQNEKVVLYYFMHV